MRALCPIHDAYGVLGLNVVIAEQVQHLDAGVDAEDAIITPSSGLRIQVRSGIDGLRALSPARAHGEGVAHGVDDNVAAQRLGGLDKPVPGLFV